MQDISLGVIETKFACMIWDSAPVSSSQIVSMAQESLGWKKSTTYTVLKRLCEKGIFENNGGTVTVKISKDDFYSLQSKRFVEENFQGSLPAFLAAFAGGKKLSAKEVAELRKLVQEHEEG